ncbi:MAG: aminotransferase class V-fold PLP-dependent enzyme [Candidatus Heimdallarchaeaceae archaeon]
MSISTRFGVEFNLAPSEIYLDSATVGRTPVESVQVTRDFYTSIGGINRGTHKYAIESSKKLEESRKNIAGIFKVNPKLLSFLPSRETALINALFSLNLNKKNTIVTSVLEDHSLLGPLLRVKEILNYDIEFLGMKDEENLLESLKNVLEPEKTVVVLDGLTLGLGALRDWEKIAELCKREECPFILDISYLVGHLDINFSQNQPDIVIASGSSGALGPLGVTFQILNTKMNENLHPLVVGGNSIISLNKSGFKLATSSSKFEAGAINVGGIIGLSKSLELLRKIGFSKIQEHEKKLKRIMLDKLSSISSIQIIHKPEILSGPIMSFSSEKFDSHDIAIILEDIAKIYVRSGALCSHLFLEEIKKESLVQISTHVYNTEEEVLHFCDILSSIVTGFD